MNGLQDEREAMNGCRKRDEMTGFDLSTPVQAGAPNDER